MYSASKNSRKIRKKYVLSHNLLKIGKHIVWEENPDWKQYEITITRCGGDSKCAKYGDSFM